EKLHQATSGCGSGCPVASAVMSPSTSCVLTQERHRFAELLARALVDECLDCLVDRQPPFITPFRRRLVGGRSKHGVLDADAQPSRLEFERRADAGAELAGDAGFLPRFADRGLFCSLVVLDVSLRENEDGGILLRSHEEHGEAIALLAEGDRSCLENARRSAQRCCCGCAVDVETGFAFRSSTIR